jgi:hypothetical protein
MAFETTSHRRINKLSHRSGRRKVPGEAALVSDAANCFWLDARKVPFSREIRQKVEDH